MALLGLTDHNILTYGTFGLWSTIFSENFDTKHVILPLGYEKTELTRNVLQANFTNWHFI